MFFFLCITAFVVLLNFNLFTIILALGSMPLAFTYPLMKRYTYWPQLFLGITFNYGLILGYTAVKGQIDLVAILFYLGAIFWTLGYDTIYGYQDIKDDEIIGLKSTSIKFKSKPYLFLFICYILFIFSIISLGIISDFAMLYFLCIILLSYHLFFYQLKNVNFDNPISCFNTFKSNNLFGLFTLFTIIIGKI